MSELATRLGKSLANRAGNKARLLDKAAAANLPVPQGYVLANELYQRALETGAIGIAEGAAIELLNREQLLTLLPSDLKPPYAVRSAFSAEDTASSSMAGYFKSFLFVSASDLPQRVVDVWQSSFSFNCNEMRRDVLLMEMVDAKTAGVAFSEKDFEDDLVNYTDGTADSLVSGQTRGVSIELPRLRPYEQSPINYSMAKTDTNTEPQNSESSTTGNAAPGRPATFAGRLSLLLRDIRIAFADENWDIEWADDGKTCWLIQIRPVTVASRRDECFTIANHKEILPDLPSPFMTSMIVSCQHELLSYYRQFDKDLPAGRPFIEVFKGRPYLNLSYLTEMMRHWGLPTALVTKSIGGTSDRSFPFSPQRFSRKVPVLVSMALAQNSDVYNIQRTIGSMNENVNQPMNTIAQCIERLQQLYKTLVTGMFSVTAAMSGPLATCRKLGVLEEHGSRHDTIASRMYLDLEPLRALVLKDQSMKADLQEGAVPSNAEFQQLWSRYLQVHGHRGVFESDISRPRMTEKPETVLKSLTHPMPERTNRPGWSLTGFLSWPIWMQASRAIKAREDLRYNAMKGFATIRQRILELVAPHLQNTDDVWILSIEEARKIDEGIIPDPQFLAARKKELEDLAAYALPDLIRRFDDLTPYSSQSQQEGITRLRGVSLTTGRVSGKALVLMEPVSTLPEGFEPATTILVARSVDAGWIPTFTLVRGVIVEIGGDLSHGSIILRETGIPATTNVGRATRLIKTGDTVLLDAGTGVIELQDQTAV